MALSKYDSTRETTNLARVARIILGPCTDVLRAVLANEMLPAALSHNVKTFFPIFQNVRTLQSIKPKNNWFMAETTQISTSRCSTSFCGTFVLSLNMGLNGEINLVQQIGVCQQI